MTPILQAQAKMDGNGGRNIRFHEKVIEVGYFKEHKLSTSLCASMLEESNLNIFSSGTSVNGTKEDNYDIRIHEEKEPEGS